MAVIIKQYKALPQIIMMKSNQNIVEKAAGTLKLSPPLAPLAPAAFRRITDDSPVTNTKHLRHCIAALRRYTVLCSLYCNTCTAALYLNTEHKFSGKKNKCPFYKSGVEEEVP